MSTLGRWLGDWAGRWFGGDSGGLPRHTIVAASVVSRARVGAPTVAPRVVEPPAPPGGGFVAPQFLLRHRLYLPSAGSGSAVGAPALWARLSVASVAAHSRVGRALILPRRAPLKLDPARPAPRKQEPAESVDLLREDEELMLLD